MKKFWTIYTTINAGGGTMREFSSLEDAREAAKRMTKDNPVFILECIEATKVPVPAIEIVKVGP